MAVDFDSLTTLHPEFSSVDEDRVAAFIALAVLRVSSTQWGVKADMGVTALACHLLSKALASEAAGAAGGGGGVAGPVTSETVGDVSATYADATSAAAASNGGRNADLMSTSYGREYLSLRSEIFSERVL